MRITEKLRMEFPGIYALFGALKRVWTACLAYNKAIKAVSVIVFAEPTNEWVQKVSERSPLSYKEALYVYKFITEESDLYMIVENDIMEFVIDCTGHGYCYYEIIGYLRDIDTELNKYVCNVLRMR